MVPVGRAAANGGAGRVRDKCSSESMDGAGCLRHGARLSRRRTRAAQSHEEEHAGSGRDGQSLGRAEVYLDRRSPPVKIRTEGNQVSVLFRQARQDFSSNRIKFSNPLGLAALLSRTLRALCRFAWVASLLALERQWRRSSPALEDDGDVIRERGSSPEFDRVTVEAGVSGGRRRWGRAATRVRRRSFRWERRGSRRRAGKPPRGHRRSPDADRSMTRRCGGATKP